MASLALESDVGNASSGSRTHSPFPSLETQQLVSSLINPINFNGFVVLEIHQIFKAMSFVSVYFWPLRSPGSKQDIYWSNHNKIVHVSLWMCWLGIMPILGEMTRINHCFGCPIIDLTLLPCCTWWEPVWMADWHQNTLQCVVPDNIGPGFHPRESNR